MDISPQYTQERIRGVHINDIFVVGHFGLGVHYNGRSWRHYPEVALTGIDFSRDYKPQLMIAVGFLINQRAVILRMRR